MKTILRFYCQYLITKLCHDFKRRALVFKVTHATVFPQTFKIVCHLSTPVATECVETSQTSPLKHLHVETHEVAIQRHTIYNRAFKKTFFFDTPEQLTCKICLVRKVLKIP